jgi:uncharacterized membrane protein
MNGFVVPLTAATLIGSGMMAGLYTVFSVMVMRGLGRLPGPSGVAAMQAINQATPNAAFGLMFFGPALGSAALMVVAVGQGGAPSRLYLLIGGGLYLASVVLTLAYHVPRNNALAAVDPAAAGADRVWTRFRSEWVPTNHLRAGLALGAAVAFTVALRRLADAG